MLHKGSNMPEFVLNCEREHPLLCVNALLKQKQKKPYLCWQKLILMYLRRASTSTLESRRCERRRSPFVTLSLTPSPVPAGRRTEPGPPWCLRPAVQASFWASSLLVDPAWTDLFFWCLQSRCWREKDRWGLIKLCTYSNADVWWLI